MEQALGELIKRISNDNRIILIAGNVFTKADGFWLYLPAEGVVHYSTYADQEGSEVLAAGYHPSKFKKVFPDTAVNVTILF